MPNTGIAGVPVAGACSGLLRFQAKGLQTAIMCQCQRRRGWMLQVYLSNIMYAMAVLINLLGCVWLFTARCEGYDQSWLTSVGDACPVPAKSSLTQAALNPLHALLIHV